MKILGNYQQKFKDLLDSGLKFKPPTKEKTVFSIGGRGHYENPISDVLAFFIDPREEHNFDVLFISSFLKLLNNSDEEINLEEGSVELVEREAVTDKGKRIDLVIVGENWVLVIENKIYHDLLNPLKDYEKYIKSKYQDKKMIYAVLSINEINDIPDPWENVLYQDLILEIKNNSGPYMFQSLNAKWSFFLQDFLLNIEEMIGEYKVDHEMIDFVQKNYSDIMNLIKVKDNYIVSLRKSFSVIIKENTGNKVTEKIHYWSKNRVAIRFYCSDEWGEQTNLVLVLLQDGNYKVYYYVYGIEESMQELEKTKLLYKGYRHWTEGKGKILCYKSDRSFDFNNVKEEFKLVLHHVNEYYCC